MLALRRCGGQWWAGIRKEKWLDEWTIRFKGAESLADNLAYGPQAWEEWIRERMSSFYVTPYNRARPTAGNTGRQIQTQCREGLLSNSMGWGTSLEISFLSLDISNWTLQELLSEVAQTGPLSLQGSSWLGFGGPWVDEPTLTDGLVEESTTAQMTPPSMSVTSRSWAVLSASTGRRKEVEGRHEDGTRERGLLAGAFALHINILVKPLLGNMATSHTPGSWT